MKTVENKISKETLKEHADDKKARQTLNKLIVGSNMKKEEAKKAIESLKTNDAIPSRSTRGKKIDFKALASGK